MFNMFLNVTCDEADMKSRFSSEMNMLLRQHNIIDCTMQNCNISESEIIGHDIHLMFGENGPVCAPEHFKCQVAQKKRKNEKPV